MDCVAEAGGGRAPGLTSVAGYRFSETCILTTRRTWTASWWPPSWLPHSIPMRQRCFTESSRGGARASTPFWIGCRFLSSCCGEWFKPESLSSHESPANSGFSGLTYHQLGASKVIVKFRTTVLGRVMFNSCPLSKVCKYFSAICAGMISRVREGRPGAAQRPGAVHDPHGWTGEASSEVASGAV